jgi:hypothetical protein
VTEDLEVDAFALFYRLYLVRMRWEGEDGLWWIPSKRGLFGVKSFYSVMSCNDGIRFSCRSVLRTKFSLGVAFFV